MRIPRPFVQLPITFDSAKLAAEIAQFDENDWRPHPQGFEGNSSMILVSSGGTENDDLGGAVSAAPRLQKAPYLRQVMACFGSVIGRSRLMRLEPGTSVSQHTDSHYFWRKHLRIHIPIITDPKVAFYCGEDEVHMPPGESWTFNNWLPHSVENRSDKARIHLVIDTVGSAALWRMINGLDTEARHLGFDTAVEAELRFETHDGLAVMPPEELEADLIALCKDISVHNITADIKQEVELFTRDFLHDWNSQWMADGLSISGFPAFKSLLEAYRQSVSKLPEDVRLSSNGEPFKEAALFTLDAALIPDKFTSATHQNGALGSEPTRPKFDRPIFIVAAPRSGSTLLFETMAVNREVWSIGDESHKQFESIASLRPSGKNPSNRLSADQATTDIKETLLDSFTADLVNADGKRFADLTALTRPSDVRFLEKTPKNALRIPFLMKVFPDARFIFLYRDPRQNMSSLLESWRSKSWVTYPTLPGWPKDKPWSHLLIPEWQNLTKASLAEIVAQQWLQTNQTILDDLNTIPSERWCSIEYDYFLQNTGESLHRLCQFSEVIFGPRMRQLADKPLKYSKYTQTAPDPEKWRKNETELSPVIPATLELLAKLRGLQQ
jgi:hypothetical protein